LSTDAETRSVSELADLIRGGLTDYREQFTAARCNEDFFRCQNRLYLEKRPNEETLDFNTRPKQFSRMTRRAVETLTSKLYSPGPQRKGTDAAIDQLIEMVAEKNSLNALMQRADQMATLNGWAAVQAVATGNPDDPVRLYLFGPDELAAFPREDDPLNVWAVVTKSIIPGSKPTAKRIRYEAWSDLEWQRYETKDFDPHQTAQTEAWSREARPLGPPEPHGYGVLPFTFCFNSLPINRFGGDGIGDALREANQEVDRMLSDMAQLLEAYNRPQGFARNVADAFRWADRVGRFTKLPVASSDAVEAGLMPEVFYLQPSVDVGSTWEHIAEFVNLTFQDLNVPLTAVRAQAMSSAESGVAIVAKHAPLIDYTRARQVPFTRYERELATMIGHVYGTYYGVAIDPAATVDVVWPEPSMPINSTEQASTDASDMSAGLATKVQIIARRYGLTRDQAIERLQQMAEDERLEMEIMGEVNAAKAQQQMALYGDPANVQLQQGQGEGQGQAEDDPEAEAEA
jgi:hypothetical protein